MKRLLFLLGLLMPTLVSAQSIFVNDKVQAGATCPPVNIPGGGAGTLYTCTGTGALYTWTGSAWVAAGGGGGGTIGGTIASPQVAYASGADTIAGDSKMTWGGMVGYQNGFLVGDPQASIPAVIRGLAGGDVALFTHVNNPNEVAVGIESIGYGLGVMTSGSGIGVFSAKYATANSNSMTAWDVTVGANSFTGLGMKGLHVVLDNTGGGTQTSAYGLQISDMSAITTTGDNHPIEYGTNKFVVDKNGNITGTSFAGLLTSATGLPISTGVSGLGANVATWLATPSSANLAAALSDETGSGLAVFGTSPALTGPIVLTEAVGSTGFTVTGATQTSNFPALSVTQTWNAVGTTFTGLFVNITSTASSTSSLLADFQLGGTTKSKIPRTGGFMTQGATANDQVIMGNVSGGTTYTPIFSAYTNATGQVLALGTDGSDNTQLKLGNAGTIQWQTTKRTDAGSAAIILTRDADGVLAQRNSTNAQAFNLYNTFTSATNNEYFNALWSSNVLHVGTNKGSGGGTARVMQLDYGGTTTSAISVPITSGTITFGGSATANYYIGNGSGLTVANVGANSCGTTAATVAGGASSFEVTVGATSGTQCRVTLPTAAPNRWNCAPSNTTTAALVRAANIDTTNVDLLGVFTAGDVIAVVCVPR